MKKYSKLSTSVFIAASFLVAFSFVFNVNASDCDSVNNALNSKFRFLGSWSPNGRPAYLDPDGDVVSVDLINFVNQTLPETVRVPASNDEYFNDNVQLNTELLEPSKVYLTMVHEGAGWTNTLGFYTYDLNNPPQTVYDIDSLVVIFPNVTEPNVIRPGDKVYLGDFPAGIGIGYFMIAQGWVGDTICLKSHMLFTDKRFNTFTTPRYQQHTILLNYVPENQILLCFEDQKRPGGDNDFNDAVFYITADPGSIDTTNIPVIPTAFLSGNTVLCDESDPAQLTVEFKGTAPFAFTYTNGIEEVSLKDINELTYSFETTLKDSIWISKFSDAKRAGIPSGKAIVQISDLNATISSTTEDCQTESTTVNIGLTGASPWILQYKFGDVANTFESESSSIELKFDSEGTLILMGISDLYCQKSLDTQIEISLPQLPSSTIKGDTTICEGGEATITIAIAGEAPFTFVYSDGETEFQVTTEENTYTFTTGEFKTYTLVSVQDANCPGTVEGSATVSDGKEGINVEIVADESSCKGEEIALALNGETENINVLWTSDGTGELSDSDELTTTYVPGDNESGIIVFYAEVSNGCAVKTVSKEVNIIGDLNAGFTFSPDDNILVKTPIRFSPEQSDYDSYHWNFGDGNESDAIEPEHEYTQSGKYEVELTMTLDGCEGSSTTELEILLKDELYIPNAFNPSAINPENQVVKVYGSNVSEEGFSFKIVNRWGKIMYNTNSFFEANNVGWSGVNRNTDEDMELNVFTYIVKGKYIDGEAFQKVGTITIVK